MTRHRTEKSQNPENSKFYSDIFVFYSTVMHYFLLVIA